MPAEYLPLAARTEIQAQVDQLQAAKDSPIAYAKIADKDKFNKRLSGEKARLESLTPPDTTGEEKDKIRARISMLQAAMISGNGKVSAMNTQMDQEKAPAGAVGRLNDWDQYWKHHTLDPNGNPIPVDPRIPGSPKAGVWEIKDLMRTLNKEREEYDPEVGSIEMFRPKQERGGPSLIDHDKLSYQAMPRRLTYEEYMALFPDYQPPPHAAFLYKGGPEPMTGKSEDAPPVPATAEGPGKYLTCQANTKKGRKCNRPSVNRNKPWCVAAGHKDQFIPPTGPPEAEDEE